MFDIVISVVKKYPFYFIHFFGAIERMTLLSKNQCS